MNAEDIRAFMDRDWDLIAESKADYWRDPDRVSISDRMRIMCGLNQFAKSVHPDWPNERERAEDFAMHERLAELLSRCPDPRVR
ncbi:MAG: hypothetical protein U0Q16_24835 [Bryobacteraceae bacterium]